MTNDPTKSLLFKCPSSFLKEVTIQHGKTGRIAFDDKGDRVDSNYDIINIVNGKLYTVGEYIYSHVSFVKVKLS